MGAKLAVTKAVVATVVELSPELGVGAVGVPNSAGLVNMSAAVTIPV